MRRIPAKEIGFQLQAQGSTAGVTPQSARVRAKAPRQAGLTFSINSHCLSHNTPPPPPLNRKTARRNAKKENKEKRGGGWGGHIIIEDLL